MLSVVSLVCVCCPMIPGKLDDATGAKAMVPTLSQLIYLTKLKMAGEYR